MTATPPEEPRQAPERREVISRRDFLEGLGFATGGMAVGIAMGVGIPRLAGSGGGATPVPVAASPGPAPAVSSQPGTTLPAIATAYPRLKVGTISALKPGDAVDFHYPTSSSPASLFKLGRPAAGGIGPGRDIVAFATDCTHMGCPLRGLFKPEHAVLGPCVCHFTTFDLSLRGAVVIGQATENLPQIILDTDGDEIFAIGTLGILYGFRDNLADAPIVEGL